MKIAFTKFRTRQVALLSCYCAMGLLVGTAKADFVNGSFGAGDLTGWTVFTTSNGTNGAGLPMVGSFDTTGRGASNSAEFNVGETTFTEVQEGGGIGQGLTLGPGSYEITAAVASQDDADGQINSAAGLFRILEDGTSIGSIDLGGFFSSDQILRGTLTASFTLAVAGAHRFEIEVSRPFLSSGDATPTEYLTSININRTSTLPEPSAVLSLMGALGALAFRLRRLA